MSLNNCHHNRKKTAVLNLPTTHFMRVDPQGQLDGQPHVLVAHARRLGRVLQDPIPVHVLVEADAAITLPSVGRLGEPVVRKPIVEKFGQFRFEYFELFRIAARVTRVRSFNKLRQEENRRGNLILHDRRWVFSQLWLSKKKAKNIVSRFGGIV